MTILTGWKAAIAWLIIAAVVITEWEVFKSVYCFIRRRRYSVFGEKGMIA